MGYGDCIPPSGYHKKKPLSKAQFKKLQDSYKRAERLNLDSKIREQEEQEIIMAVIEKELNTL